MPQHDLPAHRPPSTSAHSLAESLGPALRTSCSGQLGPIEWFRVSWQHGGAATGFAEWSTRSGRKVKVLVKLPIGPIELRWTRALGQVEEREFETEAPCHHPTPRILACGAELAGYDIAWIITERLAPTTLSHNLSETAIQDMLATLDAFHQAAGGLAPVEGEPKREDWEVLLEKARDAARTGDLPESQRWNEALKRVQKILEPMVTRWEKRPLNAWCHGDFHGGNALRRFDQSSGCVLIDLALVHPGHWLEDALYLERQFWARPELLHGIKPVTVLGRMHRERGMDDPGYVDLANVRRVLMGSSALSFVSAEGHPKYLHACLETVERLLPQLPH